MVLHWGHLWGLGCYPAAQPALKHRQAHSLYQQKSKSEMRKYEFFTSLNINEPPSILFHSHWEKNPRALPPLQPLTLVDKAPFSEASEPVSGDGFGRKTGICHVISYTILRCQHTILHTYVFIIA